MITDTNYKSRLVDKKIDEYLNASSAIVITGPKYCGKTTTGNYHAGSSFLVADPKGNYENRELAKLAPSQVLIGATPRLIDEWQESPQLWDAVRFECDMRNKSGQFILTGSSLSAGEYLHSGAGRITPLEMTSMTLYEAGDSNGLVSINSLFEDNALETPVSTGTVQLSDIIHYCVRGGWPGNLDKQTDASVIIPRGYIDACLNKDVENHFSKKNSPRKKSKVSTVLRKIAELERQTYSIEKLRNEIADSTGSDITRLALDKYFDIFEALYLTYEQKPFLPRVKSPRNIPKTPKRRMIDPSLAVAARELSPSSLYSLPLLEEIYDCLVAHDLSVYAQTLNANFYFYKDSYNLEIEGIIQLPDGRFGALKNCLGVDEIDDAAKNLHRFSNLFEDSEQSPSFLCVVCGLSNAAYRRPDGVLVVPLTALRP